MSETPQADAPAPQPFPAAAPVAMPPENRTRGTLLALLIIPAGVIVWTIVAALGYISALVGIGVALGALALYRFGSGGRISYNGAGRVSAIIAITMILSFIGGIVIPNDAYFARALANGRFFEGLAASLTGGNAWIDVLLALAFTVIGAFMAFRTAFGQAKQEQVAGPAI